MSSQRQIQANRRNGSVSNGPKTPEGKAVSAKNALKHGLLSGEAMLPNENPERFRVFADELCAELAPESELERALVGRIIGLLWRLERIGKLEAAILLWKQYKILARESSGEPRLQMFDVTGDARRLAEKAGAKDLALLGEAYIDGENSLAKLSRYETGMQRNMIRALHELQRLKAARQGEHVLPPQTVDVDVAGNPEARS
jgi:hypothetical protein